MRQQLLNPGTDSFPRWRITRLVISLFLQTQMPIGWLPLPRGPCRLISIHTHRVSPAVLVISPWMLLEAGLLERYGD